MEFRLLGPLEVLEGDKTLEIAGTKRRALLALLLLRANEVVRSERLIDDLWGENPPANAPAALRSHISRLRGSLGSELLARLEWGYVLRTPPESIDLRRFEQLLGEADPLPAGERAMLLAEALALWRGPPLADLALEPGLQREIDRLQELHVATLERRIDADLEAGRNSELIGELEGLIAEHPLREHLRSQLILALYRAGRQAEALEVYRETRRVLSEELGLEPSPELRELERAILRQDPSLAPTAAASSASTQPTEPRPLPPASRRRRWLAGGIAASVLLAAGAATAAVLTLTETSTDHSAAPPTTPAQTTPETVTHPDSTRPTETGQPATTTAQSTRHRRAAHPTRTAETAATTTHSTTTHAVTATATTSTAKHSTRVKPKTIARAPAKPVTITDAFGGRYVDPVIWQEVSVGGDVSIAEQGGQLQLTVGSAAVPGGTYNQIDVHVGTQCAFPGNFDARVDYSLLEWPAGDNIMVGLNAIYANGGVMRENNSQSGDIYTSWVIPSNTSIVLPDSTGSLRIDRTNGMETTYFMHQGTWRKLATAKTTGAAVLGLQAFSDHNVPFGGQEIKVAFDNFSVTGVNPICQPGSDPRTP
jgi:DNA-binding SARP family transcriptional activator